jgi:phage baseplate assembly protein W
MALESEVALLGRDIYAPEDEDADLKITASGDVALIEGRANLHAGIRRRIVASPGEMIYRPEYGCGLEAYVESETTPAKMAQLANDIRRNCLRDPRLADCEASVTDGIRGADTYYAGTVTIELEVTLRQSGVDQMTMSYSG